ncbi:hypothetical protein BKA80DRAFT_258645 [Phyllosticta citrichinensis]
MVLPPLAILIPRLIRILELVVDVYGIVAPCVGCALRGCFGECGCSRGKRGEKNREGQREGQGDGEGEDECDCPARLVEAPEGQELGQERKRERKSWFAWSSSSSKSKSKEKRERRKLHKDPPPSASAEAEVEADHALAVLQQQYSTLPQPPTPETPETPVLRPLRHRHRVGQSE